jgi:LCP family protein required for cell wall assembly
VEDAGTEQPPVGYPGTDDPDATDPGVAIPPVSAGVTPAPDPGGPELSLPALDGPDAHVPPQDEESSLWPPPEPPSLASRWRAARKVLLISLAVLVVLIAGIAAVLYLEARHDLSSMRRLGDPFASIPPAVRAPRPTGPAAKDVTFLVGGLDSGALAPTPAQAAGSTARGRTDTLMLVHLIAGGRGAYVVSIPRDSWVPIPGHRHGKVSSAYALGGPALTIRTVEHLTNVRIDHFAIISWVNFRSVTDALGGVTVTVPVTTYDPANQVTWTAGSHHLNGTQALLYVRDRHGLASADFGNEQRQQNYLRAMFQQVRRAGTLANPLKAGSVMHALSGAVSVDSTLSVSDMLHLALSLRGLSMSRAVFAAAPYLGTGTAGGQSVVRLNKSIGPGFWHAFEYDSLPAFVQQHGLHPLGAATP